MANADQGHAPGSRLGAAGSPFKGPLLLLELSGPPHALVRLGRLLGELIEGPREVALYLGDRTPEEVLAACAAYPVKVWRSRVIAPAECDQSPEPRD